jgi:splicing factor U2AF subunit
LSDAIAFAPSICPLDRYSSSRDDRGYRPSRRDYDDNRYSGRRDTRDRDDRHNNRRDDYSSSRAGRYDDDRYGERNRYEDREHKNRSSRTDRDDRGRGREGGGRGWRDATPERRSPTPEGALPLSQRKRKATGWDLHAPGYERYSAMQAKATG